MSQLLLDLTDHLLSSYPLFSCFFLALFNPLVFFPCVFTSSHPPNHPLLPGIIPISLLSSILGHPFTTSIFTETVTGECASWGDDRKQGHNVCLVFCPFALNRKNFTESFDTSRVWNEWWGNEGDVLGKRTTRREFVAVALSFLDPNRVLLGSGKTFMLHVCMDLERCVLKYFRHVHTHLQ